MKLLSTDRYGSIFGTWKYELLRVICHIVMAFLLIALPGIFIPYEGTKRIVYVAAMVLLWVFTETPRCFVAQWIPTRLGFPRDG